MNKNKPKVIGQRGSIEWQVHYFRRDSLVSLMHDLVDQEKDGLQEAQCDQVKKCLQKLANVASSIPDHSFWRSTILDELEKFSDIYYQWNSHSGTEAPRKRRLELRRLRDQRNKLATKWRKNQHILANEIDLQMTTAMHTAVQDLVKAVPEIFKALARSVDDYARIVK